MEYGMEIMEMVSLVMGIPLEVWFLRANFSGVRFPGLHGAVPEGSPCWTWARSDLKPSKTTTFRDTIME